MIGHTNGALMPHFSQIRYRSQDAIMCSDAGDFLKVDAAVILPAMEVLTRLAFRHFVSQSLYTFVKIGAPGAMGGEALTPPEIATRLKKRAIAQRETNTVHAAVAVYQFSL